MTETKLRRWPWALSLLVLSPICAEHPWGYDDTTGKPLVLLDGLLIREAAVRLGLRWRAPCSWPRPPDSSRRASWTSRCPAPATATTPTGTT